MLSIGRIASVEYYLGRVATGAEDYYLGSGEAPGRWRGTGSAALNLSGEVDEGDYRAVFAGVQPGTRMRLVRPGTPRRPRLPGLDLTFSAPKSVSVIYGLADPGIASEVVGGHEAAVDAALAYLERHACFTRRRIDGRVQVLAADGLIVAGFRHRTSRAGDPSLHTHCLVANMVRTPDGEWGALHTHAVYRQARTARFVYQAVLRAELTRRLGVAWGPVHNGYADLIGVDAELRRGFSRRRQQIEEALERRGLSSPAAAEMATLDTRRAKTAPVDPAGLREQWTKRTLASGFNPQMLITSVLNETRSGPLTDAEREELLDWLGSDRGLTRRRASFARRDVVQAVCAAIPPGTDITVGGLETLADEFLATRPVISLATGPAPELEDKRCGARPVTDEDWRRWSTAEMLRTETALIDTALQTQHANVASVPDVAVDAALAARPGLSGEQANMVRAVCGSGDGVQVVVGAAGTGKTFALDAARDAWERSGHLVIGCALAARAARQLESGSKIPSGTIAQLLGDLDNQHGELSAGAVVVVDEAAMVDTRTLARLAEHTRRANAKLLLVGDQHQLPEIDAGGAFAGLAIRLGAVELIDNRRQHEPWERGALDQLRAGDTNTAYATYERHGRITTANTAPDALAVMVDDWWNATQAGERALMIAARNSDVDDLNSAARQRRRDAGQLHGPDLEISGREFAAGDSILFTRPDRDLHVINGTAATVNHVDTDKKTVTATTSDGWRVEVPTSYLKRRRLTHNYATTVHKAQGATVDRLFVYGDDRLYREAAYVALSRGRHDNRLYVVTGDTDLDDHRHAGIINPPPGEHLQAALRRSAAKTMAVEELEIGLDDELSLDLG